MKSGDEVLDGYALVPRGVNETGQISVKLTNSVDGVSLVEAVKDLAYTVFVADYLG